MDRSAAQHVVELRRAISEHREVDLLSYEALYRATKLDLNHSHESTEEDHEQRTKH